MCNSSKPKVFLFTVKSLSKISETKGIFIYCKIALTVNHAKTSDIVTRPDPSMFSMAVFTFPDKVYPETGQIIACGFCWFKSFCLHWIAIYINLIFIKNRET